MKQLSILITLFAFLTFTAQAQVDPKAKQVLDAVSANLKTLKSMKANFSLGISKTREKKSGAISMKGNKYYVNINSGAQEIFCDARTIYTYQKSAKEVTINDIDPTENALTPSKLFTNFYDKEYRSKFISEKKVGANTMAIIELIPLKAKQFTKVELTIDRTKNIIVGGRIFEKNGNIMSYTISNFVANPAVADNIFAFDARKYPGVETVDLR